MLGADQRETLVGFNQTRHGPVSAELAADASDNRSLRPIIVAKLRLPL